MCAELRSLDVSGKESIAGGAFDSVSVDGKLEVDGDLEARRLVVQGAVTVDGRARLGDLEVAGKATFTEPVQAQGVSVHGKVDVGGSLEARRVETSGRLTVGGDVIAGEFLASGRFTVDGTVRADRVEVELASGSRAEAIKGASVRVAARPANEGTVMKVSVGRVQITNVSGGQTQPSRLEVGTVEGDTVHLEATVARRVGGRQVRLGPDCSVDVVEYTESLEVDESARVGDAVKK
jgi:cytoskeletal protein CcmA (bactofilin family)